MKLFHLAVWSLFSVSVSAEQTIERLYMPKTVLSTHSERGVEGAFADIFREAAVRVGHDVDLRSVAWKRAQVTAKTEKGSAIGPITRVPAREDQYVWVAELLPLRLTFLMMDNNQASPRTMNELKGLRVAVLSGSVADVITQRFDPKQVDVFRGTNDQSILRMLQRGRVDGWLIWELVGLEGVRRLNLQSEVKRSFTYTVGPLYMATNSETSQHEVQRWQDTLNAMRQEGRIDQILQNHYGDI